MTNKNNQNYTSLFPWFIIMVILIAILIPLLMASGITHPLIILISLIWLLRMGRVR
ncbi:MAG: hypothetical protein J0L55_16405 [Caulobacterales bacterium]|nr:hypothetical protein [Caulobacterales bacterium]